VIETRHRGRAWEVIVEPDEASSAAGRGDGIPRCGGEEMKNTYLEVTFRHGRPLAAYYYLSRRPGEKSYRTAKAEPGLVIDLHRSASRWHQITAPASCPLLPSIGSCVALIFRQ